MKLDIEHSIKHFFTQEMIDCLYDVITKKIINNEKEKVYYRFNDVIPAQHYKEDLVVSIEMCDDVYMINDIDFNDCGYIKHRLTSLS